MTLVMGRGPTPVVEWRGSSPPLPSPVDSRKSSRRRNNRNDSDDECPCHSTMGTMPSFGRLPTMAASQVSQTDRCPQISATQSVASRKSDRESTALMPTPFNSFKRSVLTLLYDLPTRLKDRSWHGVPNTAGRAHSLLMSGACKWSGIHPGSSSMWWMSTVDRSGGPERQ